MATGCGCARLIVLLAGIRPYAGWYWLLAAGVGIIIAVAVPWACAAVFRGPARWAVWPLAGYVLAVAGGMRYFLLLRFTPPGRVPAVLPPPPLWFAAEIAGLSAVAFSIAALTLLVLAVMAEIAAPGLTGGRVRSWRARRTRGARYPGPPGRGRFPARLRAVAPAGPDPGWARGAILAGPGSLRWEPDAGSGAAPVDLTSAVIVAGTTGNRQAVTVGTVSGRAQVDCRAGTFALLPRLATVSSRGTGDQEAEREG